MRRTPRGGGGTDHCWITEVELLTLTTRRGQFPDESVRIKDTPIHFLALFWMLLFICNRIKKVRVEGKKCHTKTMMIERR